MIGSRARAARNTARLARVDRLQALLPMLSVLLAGLIAGQAFLYGSVSSLLDAELHVERLGQLRELFARGIYYARWAPDMAFGFGYPIFNFNAPLLYYLGMGFVALGVPDTAAMAYTGAFTFVMAALFAYLWLRQVTASELAAVAGAIAYVFAPYVINNALIRGAMAEHLGLALLPGLLWATTRLIKQPSCSSAAGYFLLLLWMLLGHNITSLCAVPCVALVTLHSVWWLAAQRIRALLRLGVVTAVAVGACAFFWLPALIERDLVHIERTTQDWASYVFNFITLENSFMRYVPSDVLKLVEEYPTMSMGPLLYLAALGGLLTGLARRASRRATLLLGVLGAFSWFIASTASRWLWDNLPLLQFVQFPWRWQGIISLFFSGLLGIGVMNLAQTVRAWKPALPLILVVGALLVLPAFTNLHMLHRIPASRNYTPQEIFNHERRTHLIGSTAGNEFLPRWLDDVPNDMTSRLWPGNTFLKPGPFEAEVLNDYPIGYSARIRAPAQVEIGLRQFYFAGWRILVDGVAVEIRVDPIDGTMRASVPAGEHVLRAELGSSPVQLSASWISLLSLVLGSALFVLWRAPQPRTETAIMPLPAPTGWLMLALLLMLGIGKQWIVDQTISPLRPSRLVAGQIQGIATPARINFGDKVQYLGMDAPVFSANRSVVKVDLFWQMIEPAGDDFSTAIHVRDAAGFLIAQSDNVMPGPYSSTRFPVWMYMQDTHTIPLPPNLPPGRYALQVIAYPRDNAAIPHQVKDGPDAGKHVAEQTSLVIAVPSRDAIAPRSSEAQVIRVAALAVPGTTLYARDALPLELIWRAQASPAMDVSFGVYLAQADGERPMLESVQPVAGFGTAQWQAGDVWQARYRMRIPTQAIPGEGRVLLRMSNGQQTELGTLRIAARVPITLPVDLKQQSARFGNLLSLTGFGLTQPDAATARPAHLRLFWQATAETERDYKLSLRMTDARGVVVFSEDRITGQWQRPTSSWVPGERIEDAFVLGMPDSSKTCPCQLVLLAYDPNSGQQLALESGGPLLVLDAVVRQTP